MCAARGEGVAECQGNVWFLSGRKRALGGTRGGKCKCKCMQPAPIYRVVWLLTHSLTVFAALLGRERETEGKKKE